MKRSSLCHQLVMFALNGQFARGNVARIKSDHDVARPAPFRGDQIMDNKQVDSADGVLVVIPRTRPADDSSRRNPLTKPFASGTPTTR